MHSFSIFIISSCTTREPKTGVIRFVIHNEVEYNLFINYNLRAQSIVDCAKRKRTSMLMTFLISDGQELNLNQYQYQE